MLTKEKAIIQSCLAKESAKHTLIAFFRCVKTES